MRQHELGYDDLIFYGSSATEIPRDFLLQMHVAVANMGGRKGVLSRLELLALHRRLSLAPGMVPPPIAWLGTSRQARARAIARE